MVAEKKQTGALIAFDGTDGVGKTTQLQMAADDMRAKGYNVYSTRLLGGTPIGEELRRVMFMSHPRPPAVNLHISQAIYYALADEIEKLRNQGKIVLLDRSPLSLLAYEGFGDGSNIDECVDICENMIKLFHPDAIIVYTADPTSIIERKRQRYKQENEDYFEKQGVDYFKRINQGYEFGIKRFNAIEIDAGGDIESVHKKTMESIENIVKPMQ